jgi:hypothetical protein
LYCQQFYQGGSFDPASAKEYNAEPHDKILYWLLCYAEKAKIVESQALMADELKSLFLEACPQKIFEIAP